jgi:flagellar protein FlaF
MGFSTSGSLLVIFIAMFAALGTVYTSTSNTTEQLSDARDDQAEQQSAILHTSINVTNATWDDGSNQLTVSVNNTGSTDLSVNATDLLVNGIYIENWEANANVEGQDRDLWAPGEELVIEDSTNVDSAVSTTPEQVVVVTEAGIAARADVEVL